MKSKKSSSVKGLILILIILAIVGVIYINQYYKDNMRVTITYYSGKTPDSGIICEVNGKTFKQPDGIVKTSMRISKGEKIIVKSTDSKNNIRIDSILVTEYRYDSGYINFDINLENKEKNKY
jgi:hypothetical protein